MKILFCTNTFENVQNGPSKFARAVLDINGLKLDNNVEIRILTEDISDNSLLLAEQKVFKTDIKLNSITRPWGFIYRMFPYYAALKKVRSDYEYDIIVFNNAITGIWSALFLKIPVIGMVNDYTSMATSLNNFRWDREWFRRLVFKVFEYLAIKIEKGIIVNSRFLFHKTLQTYGPDASKLRILYKGTKTDKPLPTPGLTIEGTIKVLFVKADYALGGLHDVGQALSLLKNYDFQLVIVGPDVRFKEKILSNIVAPNIKVDFVGPAAEDDVARYMCRCDLFVVPSHNEALGVANMEALLHGIPVISSEQGGIPEVLNNGKNGWMVPPNTPVALAAAIREAIENPGLRLKKRQEGYDFIRQHFDIEQSLHEFAKIVYSFL